MYLLWTYGLLLLHITTIVIFADTCPENPTISIVKTYPAVNYTVLQRNSDVVENVTHTVIYYPEPVILNLQCTSRQPVLWDFANDTKLNQFRYIRPKRTAGNIFDNSTYCFRINLFLYRLSNATGKYTCRMLHGTKNSSLFIFIRNHKPYPFTNMGRKSVIENPRIEDNWMLIPCITYNPWVHVDLYVNDTEKIELEPSQLRWNPMEGFWLNVDERRDYPGVYTCRATGEYSGTEVYKIRQKANTLSISPNLTTDDSVVTCTVPEGSRIKELKFLACTNLMECMNAQNLPPRVLTHDKIGQRCNEDTETCWTVQPPPVVGDDIKSGVIKCTATGVNRVSSSTYLYRYFMLPSALSRITTFEQSLKVFTPESILDRTSLLNVDLLTTGTIYVGQEISIICSASPFFVAEGIEWIFIMANGTKVWKNEVEGVRTKFQIAPNRPDFVMTSNMTVKLWSRDIASIVCKGPSWTDYNWISDAKNISIDDSHSPEFDVPKHGLEMTFTADEKNVKLACSARGLPRPSISWRKEGLEELPPGVILSNDTRPTSSQSLGITESVLIFTTVTDVMKGEYVCMASNYGGTNSQTFKIEVKINHGALIGIIIGALLAIIALTLIVVFLYRYIVIQRKIIMQFLSDKEIEDFFYGMPEMLKDKGDISEYSQFLPYKKEYEILPTSIEIVNEEILGSGQYGMVYKGKLAIDDEERNVAVKTVKPSADKEYVKALLSEIKIMMSIGSHPNVVNFIGALTQDLRDGKLLIVVEFCENGSLEKYLRDHRNAFLDRVVNDAIVPASDSGMKSKFASYLNRHSKYLETRNLVAWSCEIAAGLEYLAVRKVIHADLATRNILVTNEGVCKITDFGLSRQLYESSDYVKKTQVPLPWRWMSVESLRDMNFSMYSDIWAYGITLWEIFTLGNVPYPGYNWDQEFLKKMEAGLRVDKPEYATTEIYKTILRCMELQPEARISFTECKKYFHLLLRSFDPTTMDCYTEILL